ncbi:Ulp1 protease family C-terminal catalytic domain [Arabidopsis thaliana x Arabidopsis arenosa]|uniref:Ulp1 protease family C-terminal catalytic domain n=1 Tax=Arabidopsis thaliana x Arabidopsis arenosa TaxID=1240361 RepID=A0A8T2EZU7_9BRAS|nr:Ulp1 protease family C-terminal catalytic domain [Arabidopsis thaliana x Arabidopsis arenosa]
MSSLLPSLTAKEKLKRHRSLSKRITFTESITKHQPVNTVAFGAGGFHHIRFPQQTGVSASFGLFLLSRQLEVANSDEIWVVFAGTPIRFSLREFKIVTGLPCGKYPKVQKNKKRGTGGKQIPYYNTLFGLEEDVTVERVITMLTKRVVTDRDIRLRYACLALVDGFLLPTSHYPKIIKNHAEMSEDLQGFLSYPWGRLSFEMMMTSIKEREVEQLATTCVAVQGLLFALQLVVLEAPPAIEEGPPIDEVFRSDSDEEAAAGVGSRQGVALKLGNAKDVDAKCEVHVDPIIFPDSRMNPAEDLTWSDDEDDVRVENIRDGIAKVVRGRKTQPNARPAAGLRRKNKSPIEEEGERSGGIDINALTRMIDEKLKSQAEKIIKGVIRWFSENLSVDAGNSKGSVSEEQGTQAEQAAADADENSNPANVDQTVADAEKNTNHVSSPDLPNENAEADVNTIPQPRHPVPMETDFTLPSFQGDQAVAAVDDVVSFYNSVDVPTCSPRGGTNGEALMDDDSTTVEDELSMEVNADVHDHIGEDADRQAMDVDAEVHVHSSKDADRQGDAVMGVDLTTIINDQDLNRSPARGEEGHGVAGTSSSHPPKSVLTEDNLIGIDVEQNPSTPGIPMDLIPDVAITVPPVGPPIPTASQVEGADEASGRSTLLPTTLEQKTQDIVKQIRWAVPLRQENQAACWSSISSDKRRRGGCRSRRTLPKVALEAQAEEFYQHCWGSGPFKQRDFDIIKRKKHFTSKVMDALIRFCRHLLRTDDIDGEKLRVDLLGSKFVSQLTRLFTKFTKTSPPEDFVFPAAVVDLLMGVGESDHVRLFAEADCVYMPFNFDKKHWVALCVDLKSHKITILDSNIQLRRDSSLFAELQPLAAMLPYLFKQANSSGGPILLQPFPLDRPHDIPQVSSPFDSGVFSVFLIHAHAAGGVEECLEFDVAALDQEVKSSSRL